VESDFDAYGSGFLSVALTEEQEAVVLQDPDALKTLSFDKITKKKVRRYLKHVRLGEDGSTIFVSHLGEEYILPQFEDRDRSIKDTHSNGHFQMRPTLEMIQRTNWWLNMYKQVHSLVQKCDFCQRYAKQVNLLKEWRGNPPPQRPWSSISVDFLEMPASQQGHVAIVKKMAAAQTAFCLLYDVILKFGKPEIIRSDKGPGFFGEMVAWITEAENILRRTSAPYHPQSMGLVERANQTIQAILCKMSFTRRHRYLFLPFAQYSYNVMPRAMFKEKEKS